ncbi:quinone oxidoreductase family protein [Rothia aerolata]|uniref:Quinone oxidoreductase n=1 Tax=Rothia aerolata TaxID=1812262 RepID=A0A917IWN2_9MICC|nr:quinone oxidoreductase [Rothia aerolata]GGH63843.1 quinone oxidoreductase [Rothia aerolata]
MTTQNIPTHQQAILVHETGAPDVLKIAEAPVEQPGENQVLVKTAASGVNFIETYQRSGVYPMDLPYTPGDEAAGTVVAVGSGVTKFKVGDRLATAAAQSTYQEYFLVDAQQAVAVPDGISDEVAAALPLQGMTAHYLTRSTFEVKPEHTVLFHAGAGGVGGLAIQLMKAVGATVITTVSTDEKEAIARAHGADHVLRYENFETEVREITGGEGVDVVYDSVGLATFDSSLKTLKRRGMAVLFGGASGQVPPFDLQTLNKLGSLYVTRPSLWAYIATEEELTWRLEELFKSVLAGDLKVTIDQKFPLEKAAEAHAYLEDRKTRGKVILVP